MVGNFKAVGLIEPRKGLIPKFNREEPSVDAPTLDNKRDALGGIPF